jgi:hypothetical protein
MDATTQFDIVAALSWILPIVLSIGLFLAPRPRNSWLRGILAILLTWFVLVVYTSEVYNPAGIAAGHEQGLHFPEGHFDNNTVAVMLMAGWALPLLSVLVAAAVSAINRRLQRK